MDELTALGTAGLAIIAFVQLWVFIWFSTKQRADTHEAVQNTIDAQQKVARVEMGVRLYLDVRNRWDSDRMLQRRKALAYHFDSPPTPVTEQFYMQLNEDVLNFFEDLGSLLRLEYVDERLIYDFLSYYVKGWYTVCRPYIEWLQARKKDDSLFSDFKFLADHMMDRETRERQTARSQVALNEKEIKEFLSEEYLA
jgi:hypothetical protein